MNWKSFFISVMILCCTFVIGYSLFAEDKTGGSEVKTPESGYIIQSKDVVSVKFYRHTDLDQTELEVTPAGTILMPLIGEVKASGKTTSQLAHDLMSTYSQGYLKNPYITVTVLSRRYYVLGEVKAPGAYPLVGNVTVLTAITQAGGFTDFASKKKVTVIRNTGNSKRSFEVNVDNIIKNGDTSQDMMLQAGDVVNVPQSPF